MDNSVYLVDRDDYVGVVNQINMENAEVEEYHAELASVIKIKSKTGIHFTTRIIFHEDDDREEYYVFNLPQGEDWLPPKPVRKITLKTREAVQDFFNALNQATKREE